jgi:hypothetical protein
MTCRMGPALPRRQLGDEKNPVEVSAYLTRGAGRPQERLARVEATAGPAVLAATRFAERWVEESWSAAFGRQNGCCKRRSGQREVVPSGFGRMTHSVVRSGNLPMAWAPAAFTFFSGVQITVIESTDCLGSLIDLSGSARTVMLGRGEVGGGAASSGAPA